MLFSVSDAAAANTAMAKLANGLDDYTYGGSAAAREDADKMVGLVVNIVTALMAVAVLIALIGVGSTLTLSVIERTRESALLRALGFRRRQLRLMLLGEAVMITIVSAIAGAIGGTCLGYLGAHAVVGQVLADTDMTMTTLFAVNWPQTIGMFAVLLASAAVASVLPGRRAAMAEPAEALAAE